MKNKANLLLVSLIAFAIVSSECVDALVPTLMNLHFSALIHIAMSWFIRLVSTISYFVARQVAINALAIVASELRSNRASGVLLLAIHFIRMVPAVILPVASVLVSDALEVLASELVGTAGLVLAVAFLSFIAAIAAIVVVVACPAGVNATSISASELIFCAWLRAGAVVECHVFIRAIHAVRVSITKPLFGDALRSAPSLVSFARELVFVVAFSVVALMPVVFVAVVETVVVAIADVDPGHAVSIVASEQIAEAGSSVAFAIFWGLVSGVPTIVVPIAVPRSWNATVIRASEAVLRAGSLSAVQRVLV